MEDFVPGIMVGFVIGFLACLLPAIANGTSPDDYRALKQEAFQRGYMVQCLGKTGYYWECEE